MTIERNSARINPSMRTITILTDFGLDDWFVGAMKGVISAIAPRATIVDLTHCIPAGEVRSAAFALAASCRFFPRNTVHLAVVDPGVGSDRGAVCVRTRDYFFVGPDNGVLSWALRNEHIVEMRRLENRGLFRREVSQTFHGRDVFAPVAAHLAKGVSLRRLGPEAKHIIQLPWPEPRFERWEIRGEVVYIDRFGNAITNIPNARIPGFEAAARVQVRGRSFPLRPFYQAMSGGKPVAVPGSSGLLEIAVNQGDAARTLRLQTGTPVTLRDVARNSPSPAHP